MEKEMATHSSILAWKIPRTEQPGRLQSKGSQKSQDTTELLKQQQQRKKKKGERFTCVVEMTFIMR